MKYQYVSFRKALIMADKNNISSLLFYLESMICTVYFFKVRLSEKSLKWGFQKCVSYRRLVSTFSSLKNLKLNWKDKYFKNIEIMLSKMLKKMLA